MFLRFTICQLRAEWQRRLGYVLSTASMALLLAVHMLPAAAHDGIRFLNPEGLFKPSTFSQVAIAKGGTVVYISGQTARDDKSNVIGAGDVQKQAEQVFANLRTAVEAAGGSMSDIAKITSYVVGLKPDDRVWLGEMVKKNFPKPPAHTLVGISALAVPELLIEVEAVAVVD
jgi:enamine deaminase RidA (YjgF/YER057c/UK114 family)